MKLERGKHSYEVSPIGQVLGNILTDDRSAPITQLALVNPREIGRLRGMAGGEETGIPRRFTVVCDQPPPGHDPTESWHGQTRVVVHPTPNADYVLRLRVFPAEVEL